MSNYRRWSYQNLIKTYRISILSLINLQIWFIQISLVKHGEISIFKFYTSEKFYVVSKNAFQTLVQMYQNRRVLANRWQEILEFPKIKANSSIDLMNLLDFASENLRALRTLTLPVDRSDFVIFNIKIKKLDQGIR